MRKETKCVTKEFRWYSKVKKWAKRFVSKARRRKGKEAIRKERASNDL